MAITVPMRAQDFALFSPAAVRELRAEQNSAAAKAVLQAAAGEVTETSHPLARLHTEGTLPHQGIRDESIEAERDFQKMQNLAFAYRLTGERKYLVKTAEFLNAWVSVYRVSGNPIDETRWQPVVVAFDLTRGDLPAVIERKTVEFFGGMAVVYLDWLDANNARDPMNWSSHRVKLATLGAYEAGDRALEARAATAFARQLRMNEKPDGSVLDFGKRDALHYVVYDLEPLTVAALAARSHGLDWFHALPGNSVSVAMGVDWLVPYATGVKTHVEFAHSTVAFDAARDKAGEKGYSGIWDAETSVQLMAMAAWIDPKYQVALEKVEANTGGAVQPWLMLAMGEKQE